MTEFGELKLEINVVQVANDSVTKSGMLSSQVGSASVGY